jgi:hypothetical protein
MIVHLKYNNNNGPEVEEVTFNDANHEIIEKVKLKGHYASRNFKNPNKKYFEFFYDTENANIDNWDIQDYLKEYVKSIIFITKPYVRNQKLMNLIK